MGKKLSDKSKDKLHSLIGSGLVDVINEIRATEGSIQNDLKTRVPEYVVRDEELGLDGTLEEIAEEYGLTSEFNQYIKKDIVGGFRGYIGTSLHLITSLKDGIEDVIESLELGGSVAAGPETAGIGTIAVQVLGNTVQIPINIISQTIYSMIAATLGFVSGTYTINWKGAKQYAADMAIGYVGALASCIPILGSVIELGTNLDDKRDRIVYASKDRAKVWLLNRIRAEKGLPPIEKEPDLLDIIESSIEKAKLGKVKTKEYQAERVYAEDMAYDT